MLQADAMRIFRVKSRVCGKDLHSRLDKLDAVAICSDAAGSLEEFELAHHLAQRAFANKTNIAKKLKYEFLLWLSAKTDITSAMKATSPNTPKNTGAPEKSGASVAGGTSGSGGDSGMEANGFLVVVFSEREDVAERKREEMAEERMDVVTLLDAEELPLGLKEKAAPLTLERISLSRIR